jgi:hypothetical protein
MEIVKFLINNWSELISAIIGVLSAIVALALLIPGEQPEKFLSNVVDFLKKFSKK